MRHRCITLYLFACATLAFCLPLSAAGQIANSSTRLTPWGEPDLQGIWTNATLTPVERPDAQANKPVLTAEEAADFEIRSAESRAASDRFISGYVVAYN